MVWAFFGGIYERDEIRYIAAAESRTIFFLKQTTAMTETTVTTTIAKAKSKDV